MEKGNPMRLARRLTGTLAGLAGAIGFVLVAIGLYGVWRGHGEVMDWVDRVFGGADQALADVDGNLQRATKHLRETETELEVVRKREVKLADRPAAERPA